MKQTLLNLSIAVLLCFCSGYVKAQFKENIQSFGGSYGDHVIKIMHDKDDNQYVLGQIGMPERVGSFADYKGEIIDFGNLEKEITNGFIAKFNKDNECIWVRESPRYLWNSYSDFTLDNAGFVYVTGHKRYSGSVLEKLDPSGNLVWEKNYLSKEMFRDFTGDDIEVDKDGNVYVVGMFDGAAMDSITFNFNGTENDYYTEYLAKFSSSGDILWVESSLTSNIIYTDVLVDSQGNTLTAGGFKGTINIASHTLQNNTPYDTYGIVYDKLLIKRDPEGNVVWVKSYPLRINGSIAITLDKDDNIYFTTQSSLGDPASVIVDGVLIERSLRQTLVKLDAGGTVKWAIPFTEDISSNSLIFANESIYLACSSSMGFQFGDDIIKDTKDWSGYPQSIYFVKVSLDGKTLEAKSFGGDSQVSLPQLSFLPKQKEVVLAGNYYQKMYNNDKFLLSKGNRDIFIGQLTDTLRNKVQIASISGRLYEDTNLNCAIDSTEKGLANKLLKIEPGSQYITSDEQGNYSFKVPYGSYTITPLISPTANSQLISGCKQSAQIEADSLHQEIANVDFGYKISDCYQLTVDIAADRRRRCMRSNTTVTYTNEGSLDAHNVKIKVLYPKYVVPITSSLPWVARQDSALVFEIGTLKPGERKSFVITDSTICGNEGIRGLSQCVTAIITPKSTCGQTSHSWDHASVAVAASFADQEQTAEFSITNEGTGNMADSTSYRIYANYALIKKGKVKLRQGSSTTLEIPAQSVTYRLEADQVLHHPGKSRPVASLQPLVVSDILPAPVDAFYLDDADAEVDISCLEIVDSYDPNDKQVSPKGITSRNYIKAEDELEYLIRFQNTGTDVAYNVIVKDSLSEHLDVSTLRVGSASHPFTYTISGSSKPVITFTFKNINLSDHKADEPGSHGYIKFAIAQNPDNPKGTVIRNMAYNYFDFNSPIATNEVINIIGDTVLVSPVPVIVYDCSEEEPSIAQATTTIYLCETNKTTLQANEPAQGIGRWKLVSGQATIIDPESPVSEVQDIGYGETVLEWTITLCKKVSKVQVKINRSQVPPAPQIAEPPLQCEGDVLMPLIATGSNITWYQDVAKQNVLFSGSIYTPKISATTAFYATQSINGCESPVTEVVVNVHPQQIIVTANADTLTAPKADSYQWYFNNQPIKADTDRKLVVKNTGQYYVKTLTNSCTSYSTSVNHVIDLPASVLKLSPNPAQRELLIEFASNTSGEMKIYVRNQLGEKIMSLNAQKNMTVLESIISVASLAPGMYFLDVHIGKEVHKAKFVKL